MLNKTYTDKESMNTPNKTVTLRTAHQEITNIIQIKMTANAVIKVED